MLVYYNSQAQKDSSAWQTLKRPINSIKKTENTVTKSSVKADSIIQTVQDIPLKYIKHVDKKIDKYSDRITSKTEKTLAKLSKWENKIKGLLEKASPETANRLFAPGQVTFSSLLQKYKEGKSVADNYKAQYDEYRDKLTTGIKYIGSQKSKLEAQYLEPVQEATDKANKLEEDISNTEAVDKFIKERKKQLMDQAVKYIGNSKYLKKINKESYYYVETLRNYKEIFSDPQKAEETAKTILNKIPAFRSFMSENSMLASLFNSSSNSGSNASLTGLQTRNSVNEIIQNQISSGGSNARELIAANINAAQSELKELKEKILKAGGNSSDGEMPDFKPNEQKKKTFLQRLQFGSNFQTTKGTGLLPATTDIGLSLGYKINNKSIVGIGASYKLGLGNIERIRISNQGLSFRSFIDWKLKKQFFVSGGFEMNYHAQFKNINQLQKYNDWQKAGLIGLSKKISLKTKFIRGTQLQLLYDILYRQHVPVTQPVIFRVGYQF